MAKSHKSLSVTASNRTEQPKTSPLIPVRKEDGFTSHYANNVRYESTVYDLKLIFGQTDLSEGTEVVRQHTSVALPWPLVKLLLYYLRLNLEVHELYNGKVTIPPQQIPIPFPHPTPEAIASDSKAETTHTIATRIREEFLASLQEH
jgi:hypothetical protein